MTHLAVFRPLEARFFNIPQAPLCYWLRERFFELLAGRTLGDVADVCQGLTTANDARFVRFVWEVPANQWPRPVRRRRWVPFEKGSGYGKWFAHHFWAVDLQHHRLRVKATPGWSRSSRRASVALSWRRSPKKSRWTSGPRRTPRAFGLRLGKRFWPRSKNTIPISRMACG